MPQILMRLALPLLACTVFSTITFVVDRDAADYLGYRLGIGKKRNEAAIAGTLKRYNAYFTDLYDTNGARLTLNDFPATRELKHEVFTDIGHLRNSGRVQILERAGMTPLEIRLTGPGTAEALIYEEWNYLYQRLRDRLPFTLIKGMGQGFKYHLHREHGAWIVDAWEPADVKDPHPEKQSEFTF